MKILLVLHSGLGDLILSNALITLLHQRIPNSQIDVVVSPQTAVVTTLFPGVTHTYPIDFSQPSSDLLATQYEFGKALRHCQYNRAYVARLPLVESVLPLFARIPHRIGWNWRRRYFVLNDRKHWDRRRIRRLIDCICGIAFSEEEMRQDDFFSRVPRPKLALDSKTLEGVLAKFNLNPNHTPYLVFCPGTSFGNDYRRWPIRYFSQLLEACSKLPYQLILMGAPHEVEHTQLILETLGNRLPAAPQLVNLVGKTTILEGIYIISGATATITNDSGMLHAAEATDTPLVAMYHGTRVNSAPPLSQRTIGLFADPFDLQNGRYPPHPGEAVTLAALPPERVYAALLQLLERYPPGTPKFPFAHAQEAHRFTHDSELKGSAE